MILIALEYLFFKEADEDLDMSLNDVQCSLMSLELLTGRGVDENENKVKSESSDYDTFEMLKRKRRER